MRLAARRSAVQAPGDAQRQLHALVIAAPEVLQERLRSRSTRQLVASCARLGVQASWDVETATTAATLPSLARRIRELTSEAADHRQAILGLVRAWRPDLLTRAGVGPIVAATVLCAWSPAGRCRSDAAFAMLGGAAPIPASSGQTVRVRLNRSGDRQLNQALYTVVLTRLRTDPATRAYAERRRAQGKTNREVKRCLVHDVARQPYRLLEAQPSTANFQVTIDRRAKVILWCWRPFSVGHRRLYCPHQINLQRRWDRDRTLDPRYPQRGSSILRQLQHIQEASG